MEYYHYVMVGTVSLLGILGYAGTVGAFFWRVKQLETKVSNLDTELRMVRDILVKSANDLDWLKKNWAKPNPSG